MAQLDAANFSNDETFAQDVFRSRVARYEAMTEGLARMVGVLGRWGDGSELPLVINMIRALYAHAEQKSGGISIWISLRWYPAVLIFTVYGIALTRAERWDVLHKFLNTVITRQYKEDRSVVHALFTWSWTNEHGSVGDVWQYLEGLQGHKTALSDHLLGLMTDWKDSFAGVLSDFELIFDRFETLASLVYFEHFDKAEMKETLGTPSSIEWIPVGRNAGKRMSRDALLKQMQSDNPDVLLRAGFAKGDGEILQMFIENLKRIGVRWGF